MWKKRREAWSSPQLECHSKNLIPIGKLRSMVEAKWPRDPSVPHSKSCQTLDKLFDYLNFSFLIYNMVIIILLHGVILKNKKDNM